MNKQKILKYWIAVIVLVILSYFLFQWAKIIKREQEMSKLRNSILKIEAKIEMNKQEWNNCATNMQLRQTENDKNREMIATLKKQYNDMVFGSGFMK